MMCSFLFAAFVFYLQRSFFVCSIRFLFAAFLLFAVLVFYLQRTFSFAAFLFCLQRFFFVCSMSLVGHRRGRDDTLSNIRWHVLKQGTPEQPRTEQLVKTWLKVALYTILQRSEYHICMHNFPLANVYHKALGRRSIIKTYSVGRIFQNPNVVAMATIDRQMLGLFFEPT